MEAMNNVMILGKDAYYDLDTHKTLRNNNVMIVGSPGSGKTRGIVIPNLLMAEGSYVVSDPKGNLCDTYGPYLKSKGYEVKRLDFSDPEKSIHYNPLRYINTDQDILKLSTVLATVTEFGDYSHTDPIWPNTSIILLSAIIAYIKEWLRDEDNNLKTVFKMLELADVHADGLDAGKMSKLDKMFKCYEDALKEEGKPESFAIKQYKKVASSAGKTFRSIVISVLSGVGKFDTEEMSELTSYDETRICDIGRKKTAFFVCVSDTDRSMDTMANVFFMQALNELCTYADKECKDNHLPIPVRFIMDDFATNCKVDQFPRMIAAFRSRWISTMLILQAESQLKSAYGEDGRTIIGSCDTYVYLGGNDLGTAKSVSERCDEPLMSVLNMPVGESIVFRRGESAIHTKGFPLEEMSEYRKAIWEYEKSLYSENEHDRWRDNHSRKMYLSDVVDKIEVNESRARRVKAMEELKAPSDLKRVSDYRSMRHSSTEDKGTGDEEDSD